MGTLKGSNNFASVRKRWDNVFEILLEMIRTQKTEIESLAEERKLFEDRIKLLQERFQDQISRVATQFFNFSVCVCFEFRVLGFYCFLGNTSIYTQFQIFVVFFKKNLGFRVFIVS